MHSLTRWLQGFHDAVGFKNTRTGLNYTMEWYTPLPAPTFPALALKRDITMHVIFYAGTSSISS